MLNDIVTLALACAWREIGNITTTDKRTGEKLIQHLPGYLLGSNDNEKLALACAWRDVGANNTGKWQKSCFFALILEKWKVSFYLFSFSSFLSFYSNLTSF